MCTEWIEIGGAWREKYDWKCMQSIKCIDFIFFLLSRIMDIIVNTTKTNECEIKKKLKAVIVRNFPVFLYFYVNCKWSK